MDGLDMAMARLQDQDRRRRSAEAAQKAAQSQAQQAAQAAQGAQGGAQGAQPGGEQGQPQQQQRQAVDPAQQAASRQAQQGIEQVVRTAVELGQRILQQAGGLSQSFQPRTGLTKSQEGAAVGNASRGDAAMDPDPNRAETDAGRAHVARQADIARNGDPAMDPDPNRAVTPAGRAHVAARAAAARGDAAMDPNPNRAETPAGREHVAQRNQDQINQYYRAGGGTWEGASREARRAGTTMNELIRNRDSARRGEAQAPSSSTTTPQHGATRPSGATNTPGTTPGDRTPGNGTNGTATFDRVRNAGARNQMVEGRITVNGNTYDFRSGGHGRGSLPAGDYQISAHMQNRSTPGMTQGGVGYSFAMNDKYDARVGGTRSLLRIHPDGGSAGTQGCIGIVGGADVQRRFREDMNAELQRNGGRYTLRVG